MARRHDVIQYVKELRDSYGPVFRLWIGPHLAVVVSDPQDVAMILSSRKTLSKSLLYRPFALFLRRSLIIAEAEVWKKSRKVINPTFARHVIDSYINTFHDKSRMLADLLEKHADGQPFDVSHYVMMCTLDMVSETSLGMPMDVQSEDNPHKCVVTNLTKFIEIAAHVVVTPWLWCTTILKRTRLFTQFLELFTPVCVLMDTIVKEKSDVFHDSKYNCVSYEESGKTQGFLAHLLSTMAANPELLTIEELKEQVLFVILAATDTTALTVSHTLMLLGLHQDVQRKVMDEQEAIFGKDIHRPIGTEELNKMVYLEQVINESMRLFPSVPFVARRVDEDVDITGYTLPAGATVVIPTFLVHRNPVYYPDPDKFDPDRFIKEDVISRPVCSFVPFLSGPRMCIGKRYAYLAMKIMLSVLLRRYQVLECGSREKMEHVVFNITLKLTNGYNIKLCGR